MTPCRTQAAGQTASGRLWKTAEDKQKPHGAHRERDQTTQKGALYVKHHTKQCYKTLHTYSRTV